MDQFNIKMSTRAVRRLRERDTPQYARRKPEEHPEADSLAAVSICRAAQLNISDGVATLIFGRAKITARCEKSDDHSYLLGGSIYVVLHHTARLPNIDLPIINTIVFGKNLLTFMHCWHVKIDDGETTMHYDGINYARGVKKFERLLYDYCTQVPPV